MAKWLFNAIGAFFCGGVVYGICVTLFHMKKAQAERLWWYVAIGILVLELLGEIFGSYGPGAGRGYRRPRKGV